MRDVALAPGAVSKDRLRLWLRILRVTRAVESDLRSHLRAEFDTTLPRFDVMAALSRHAKGLKMSELSRLLMVSNGNVTGIVERLCEDGLTLREAVPGDRRAARVRLTARGETEFRRQAAAHEIWVSGLLGGLDGADSAAATALLRRALETGEVADAR